MTTAISFFSPAWIWLNICSTDPRAETDDEASRFLRSRYSAISRARASSSVTTRSSPACGVPLRPTTSTGIAGPASVTFWPRSLISARTRPPFSTGNEDVADFERAFLHQHRRDRAATAIELGFKPPCRRPSASGSTSSRALRACSRIASSSLSRPVFLVAETSTASTSPPMSSTTSSWLSSSVFTRCGLASGRSILLIATMIGTPAALA